ncbi:hypothetical protein DFH09DRAFT_1084194 [Mycena vulgaris]|nr:hypothetical protein DFH09DRAFT_1084194 [Mycena vulgaris]
MMSLPRMFLFAALLLGSSCGAKDTSSPAARLTPLKPFIQRPRPGETIIRGLLFSRQSPQSCRAGFNLCNKTGCCSTEETCCEGGGCCAAGTFCAGIGCCPKGETCTGSGQQCASGFEGCPNDNGCCLRDSDGAVACQKGGVSSSRTGSSAKSSATKDQPSAVTPAPSSLSSGSSAPSSSSGATTSAGTASAGSSSSPPSTSTRSSIPVGGLAGIIIGGVIMLAVAVGMLGFCRRRRDGRHRRLPNDLAQHSPTIEQHRSQYAPDPSSTHLRTVVTRLPSGAVMMSAGGYSNDEPLYPAPASPLSSPERARIKSQLRHARQMELERQTDEINRELEELTLGDSASRSIVTVASRGDSDEVREIKMMEGQIRAPRRREAPEASPWAQGLPNDEPPAYSSF